MKDQEDKSLEEYLKGGDEVSAAYQLLSEEKPSAKLDQDILSAARLAVDEQARTGISPVKKKVPYQAYSIAASICLSVLAVSLFMNNKEQFTQDSLLDEMEATSIQLLNTSSLEASSADEQTSFIQENAASQSAPAALSIQLNPPEVETSSASSARLEINADRVEAEQDILRAASAQRSLQAPQLRESTATEEAAISSLDYRSSMETWLAEIQRLTQIGAEPELLEERRLFMEAYPDTDIDSALSEE